VVLERLGGAVAFYGRCDDSSKRHNNENALTRCEQKSRAIQSKTTNLTHLTALTY
jgi:hypothetical protein